MNGCGWVSVKLSLKQIWPLGQSSLTLALDKTVKYRVHFWYLPCPFLKSPPTSVLHPNRDLPELYLFSIDVSPKRHVLWHSNSSGLAIIYLGKPCSFYLFFTYVALSWGLMSFRRSKSRDQMRENLKQHCRPYKGLCCMFQTIMRKRIQGFCLMLNISKCVANKGDLVATEVHFIPWKPALLTGNYCSHRRLILMESARRMIFQEKRSQRTSAGSFKL